MEFKCNLLGKIDNLNFITKEKLTSAVAFVYGNNIMFDNHQVRYYSIKEYELIGLSIDWNSIKQLRSYIPPIKLINFSKS